MDELHHIDSVIAARVRRRQTEFWDTAILALGIVLDRIFNLRWGVDPEVSTDEVFADLVCGRD